MSAAALRSLPDLWFGKPQPRGTVPRRAERAAAARASRLPSCAAGLPAPPRRPSESRARSADSAAATGRDRPLPRDPARLPAPGRPPTTPRRGDAAGHRERTERSVRVVTVPLSPRPGTRNR